MKPFDVAKRLIKKTEDFESLNGIVSRIQIMKDFNKITDEQMKEINEMVVQRRLDIRGT